MPPASDTAIRSATDTGRKEKATAKRPSSTCRSSSPVPRIPPDEVDSLVGSHVGDAEHGSKQMVLQDADIE